MPRPRKWKKVCCLPESTSYGPLDTEAQASGVIVMAVEEYETIRLIDYERLTQEECAQKMNVARGTVQKLYTDARMKISESIIDGKKLIIKGGDYELYNDNEKVNGCRRCRRGRHGRNNSNEN
ncbi:DUF134 domain-containing protein [Alkalibacter mobilis]|uniref:DUF134 domain-containing protein n=1 Tax=Alkalibacter mobilis TaxID=2787712 RepID=UPI00189CFA8B|nr:DUF134 domain-containing protein [Alkalibacter mobilis]MBF7096986.1 DUF134 domain-containing protein [Alkalibacter mobilis]